jgi:hypothetical protein
LFSSSSPSSGSPPTVDRLLSGVPWTTRNGNSLQYQSDGTYRSSAEVPHRLESLTFFSSFRKLERRLLIFFTTHCREASGCNTFSFSKGCHMPLPFWLCCYNAYFLCPKVQVTIYTVQWTQGSSLFYSFWKVECLEMMPSLCRQVNCVNCAVLIVKDDWKGQFRGLRYCLSKLHGLLSFSAKCDVTKWNRSVKLSVYRAV